MRELARIIDANANRAREALRVMEDLARFALDDAALSARLKTLRHDLRAALDDLAASGLDRGTLLTHRDTPGDVGTTITTAAETQRTSPRDIAAAAAGRLTEALRSIEECAKALPTPNPATPPAARVERLRYLAYDLEKHLLLALAAPPCPQWTLCVLLTERLCTHHRWDHVAREAIRGGADCLQLREKDLDARELLARARTLVALAASAPHPVSVIINDRPDIALLAGAQGVHVGQTDLPVADVRAIAGFRLWVGVSTASLDQARAAIRDGADYLGCGPIYPTTTKHKPVLSGPDYLAALLADPVASSRPHLAISGITPENAPELARLGCRGVAVSSVVCSAPDPAGVCAALVAALRR